jgi:hypothetical protein
MTHSSEQPPEQFPSHEELKDIFERLLGGNEYKVLGEPRDDLFEIETMENGERVEYAYTKAKYDYRNDSLPNTAKFSASIHKTYYAGDEPISGVCVANYLDGQWEFVT